MRTLVRFALIVVCGFASAALGQSYVPGEVIVKIKRSSGALAGPSFAALAASQKGMTLKTHWKELNLYHFQLPQGENVQDAIQDLGHHPDVEYVEPNFILKKTSEGSVGQIYSAAEVQAAALGASVVAANANIGLNQVHQVAAAQGGYVGSLSSRPIIAVIDTGLDTTHYVMQETNVVWKNTGEIPDNGIDDDANGYIDDVNGWNFVAGSGQMYDDDGHGTHVSGIILSVDQDIYGATFQTAKIQIMPLKFLDSTGSGVTSDAIKAIYYAVQNGAVVLNNSWGGSDYSSALNEAIAYTYSAGATFVAAAGNSSQNIDSAPMYPASYNVPNVVAVAAITDANDLASFSNFGPSSVGLGSPGVYILSTLPGNTWGEMSGTSMATPYVAGTAIQMKVQSPNMLGYQVKNIILNQTTGTSGMQNLVQTNGVLNSSNAIVNAASATVDDTQPSYTMSYLPDRSLASNLTGGGCGMVGANKDELPPDQGLGAILISMVLVLAPLLYLFYRRARNPVNRRRYERFSISSEVRIHVGDRELVGAVSSISLGGAQVRTNALLQNGGLVTLTIASPDGTEKLEVEGRVVWSEANKAYGVAFDRAPDSILSRITEWTKNLEPA